MIKILNVRIDEIDKIQERALQFVFKDYISNYKNPMLKSGFESFIIYAVNSLMVELFKTLEGMTPNYLSELFVKANRPYDTRDKRKLIQLLKKDVYIRPTFIPALRRTCLEYIRNTYRSSTVVAGIKILNPIVVRAYMFISYM